MAVQSIGLSEVMAATFNGVALEEIKLNGVVIWKKPMVLLHVPTVGRVTVGTITCLSLYGEQLGTWVGYKVPTPLRYVPSRSQFTIYNNDSIMSLYTEVQTGRPVAAFSFSGKRLNKTASSTMPKLTWLRPTTGTWSTWAPVAPNSEVGLTPYYALWFNNCVDGAATWVTKTQPSITSPNYECITSSREWDVDNSLGEPFETEEGIAGEYSNDTTNDSIVGYLNTDGFSDSMLGTFYHRSWNDYIAAAYYVLEQPAGSEYAKFVITKTSIKYYKTDSTSTTPPTSSNTLIWTITYNPSTKTITYPGGEFGRNTAVNGVNQYGLF